jgi:cholesterol oxidase
MTSAGNAAGSAGGGTARRLAEGEYLDRDQFEALVIGSGFGGAVAACRLAQAGVDVAVVERGRRWPPGSFPRDLHRLDDGWLWLCNHGLYDAQPLNDILAVRAAGYGGGSLVYANVAMRPPEEVFAKSWPEPYTRAALEPYYDLVAHMLDVRPVPADPRTGELPPKTRLMAKAADLLGYADGFFHPNLAVRFQDRGPNRFGITQGACTFSGECDIGCNEGAKNTLDLNYLALAEQHGAAVGTLTEAVHIARAGDGYQVRLREYGHPGAGREGVERQVRARYVFVCAGALGTTELLLRSRDQYHTLPDLPAALGEGYSGNGDFLSFGDGLRDLAVPGSGPTITTAALLHTGTTADEQWFVVEEGGYSGHLAKLVRSLDVSRLPAYAARLVGTGARRVLGSARDLGARLDDGGAHTAVLLAMGNDRGDGRIELRGPGHRLHVTWDVTRNDPLYEAERAVSGQVVRALGGRPFSTPTWRLFRQPVTVHNLGGARMSSDPETGVVDTDGEVFGHPGLYVLDGAALPGATGANPSSTIAAVAERCIETAVRRITGDPDWVAPQRAEAMPRDLPEDRAVRAVVAEGGPRRTGPGLVFRETLRGTVAVPGDPARPRRRAVLRLTAQVPDLQAFLDDPVHAALLGGTVEVEGLASGPATVDRGSLHLLASIRGGRQRTMDYIVPFDDDGGSSWLLQGSKLVYRRRRIGPWRATTRLDVALTAPADRYDATVPTGTLTISVLGVARLLLSLRPTGAAGMGAAVTTLLRFARFFSTRVLLAFLPVGPARRQDGHPLDPRVPTATSE